jgi:hypothetical protein
MKNGPSQAVEYGRLDVRVYVRKVRNVAAIVLMVAMYIQILGVPSIVRLNGEPCVRLVRLDRPVWSYAWSAIVFVWSHFESESMS